MDNLNLGLDIQEICINGDENKKISFCPGDVNIINRYKESIEVFENIQNDFENISGDINEDNSMEIITKLFELDKLIKDKIDYIFNSKISDIVFGEISCLTKGVNGEPIFKNLLESLIKYCIDSYDEKVDAFKNSDKANKYLSKYKNKYVKNNDFKKSNKRYHK